MTPLAAVSWAAHLGWLDLHNSHLAFLGSTAAVGIISLLAIGELVADKLPSTPNRTKPGPLVGRILTGALSAAALCVAANQSVVAGVLLGGLGGVGGTFAGYQARHRLVTKLHAPDVAIAVAEDLLAIGGGFFFASRL